MIKTFTTGDKVNFIDDKNVVIGYDLSQQCCENAGWFFDNVVYSEFPNIPEKQFSGTAPFEDYNIDPDFFHEIKGDNAMATFRFVSPTQPDIYLHFYNMSNGYYGHGFTVNINGIETRNNYL